MADKNAVFLTRHIGKTTYNVRVYLSETAEETMEDKILRLIRNDGLAIAAPATPIFFLRKRNKNEGKVRTNGNLPFGSKRGQPGQWAFCCCRFRLFELFQNAE